MYFFEKQIITDASTQVLIGKFAQSEDYAYVERFKRETRKQQSLVGRCLIRKMATNYLPDTSPADWHIQPVKNAGPTLRLQETQTTPYISISHSHDMVIAGLSLDKPIGVDVEYMGKERDIYKIIAALTAPEDIKKLPQDKTQLYALWVLYESWYKLNPTKHSPPIPSHLIAWAKEDFAPSSIPKENININSKMWISLDEKYILSSIIEF